MCTAVQVLIGWDSASPPPPHLGSFTRALLVSQDRRHIFVTPCSTFMVSSHILITMYNLCVHHGQGSAQASLYELIVTKQFSRLVTSPTHCNNNANSSLYAVSHTYCLLVTKSTIHRRLFVAPCKEQIPMTIKKEVILSAAPRTVIFEWWRINANIFKDSIQFFCKWGTCL